MAEEKQLLNDVYMDICETLGMETAMEIHHMFKGQQITFPKRFLNPNKIREIIRNEFTGSNIRELAIKYDYSEKTIRRMLKEMAVSDQEVSK